MALLNRLGPEFLRFLAVGVLNTAVGYALFTALILTGNGKIAAAAGSTALGALFNFQSIGGIVFRQRAWRLLPPFLAVYVGQCLVNIGLLSALGALGLGPLFAQFLLLPLLAVGTFVAMRHLVFLPRPG